MRWLMNFIRFVFGVMTRTFPRLRLTSVQHATCVFLALAPGVSGSQEAASAPVQTAAVKRPISRPGGDCLSPSYPVAAARLGATGVTRVVFTVEPSGAVANVVVVRRSGETRAHAELDKRAVQSIARCEFGPALGYAPVRVAQDFEWKLLPGPQSSSSAPPAQ